MPKLERVCAKLIALCTDISFKTLNRDFFSLLLGSVPARSQKSRTTASPKRVQQPIRDAASSDTSTASSSMTSSPSSSSISEVNDLAAELLSVVAAPSGINMQVTDLKKASDTTFTDFGVDSQMSIQIIAGFEKVTAVELSAAFFTNFPTPAAVEKELGMPQPLEAFEDLGRNCKDTSLDSPKLGSRERSPAPERPSKSFSASSPKLWASKTVPLRHQPLLIRSEWIVCSPSRLFPCSRIELRSNCQPRSLQSMQQWPLPESSWTHHSRS